MMVGLLEGQFLGALVRSTGAKRILELGTFTGYSSISMALALPGDGRLVTCDVNPETTEIARRYAAEAGVVDRIDYRIGPALERECCQLQTGRPALRAGAQAGHLLRPQ